jgi:hypothetical protein
MEIGIGGALSKLVTEHPNIAAETSLDAIRQLRKN